MSESDKDELILLLRENIRKLRDERDAAITLLRGAQAVLSGLLITSRECADDCRHGDRGYYHWVIAAHEVLRKIRGEE